MIRFFEKEDKDEIIKLAAAFRGESFDGEDFAVKFDEIIDGNQEIGISVLHAGEYLGYCMAYLTDKEVIINQLYIKPEFQKLKVAPQVFDFIEAEYPDYRYQALIPRKNKIAMKVFSKRGYDIIIL